MLKQPSRKVTPAVQMPHEHGAARLLKEKGRRVIKSFYFIFCLHKLNISEDKGEGCSQVDRNIQAA